MHTDWGHRFIGHGDTNLIKCHFLRGGENRSTPEKTSPSREENQKTQPTHDAKSGNQTGATFGEGSALTTTSPLLSKPILEVPLFEERGPK